MKTPFARVALLGLLASASAAQNIIHVPADQPTIAAGIGAASHGDTVLVAPGTYLESDIRFNGKLIEVRSTHGPEQTTVDALYADRVFRFTGGETPDTLLEGFTIYRGRARVDSHGTGGGGGGVLITNGSPTLRDCIFLNNQAGASTTPSVRGGHAGALYISNGNPWVESCHFSANSAGRGADGAPGSNGGGGDLFNPPDPGGNGGPGGRGGHGGAVYIEAGSPTFVNTYFWGNIAGRGGDGGTGGRGGNGGSWVGSGGDGGRGGNGGHGGEGGAAFVQSGLPFFVNCTAVAHNPGGWGDGGAGGAGGSGVLGSGSAGADGSAGDLGDYSGIYLTSGEIHNTRLHNFIAGEIPPGKVVTYSSVRGGYPGVGNIDGSGAALRDAGDNTRVPAGVAFDANGGPRFFDDLLTADTGFGTGAIVDIGYTEFTTGYVFPYGCGNPAGSLSVSDGAATVGGALTLELFRPDLPRMNGDVASVPRAMRAGLIVGTSPLDAGCGLELAGGFLQVDLSTFWMPVWASEPFLGQPVDVTVPIPAEPALAGVSLYAQGVFVAPGRADRGGLAGVLGGGGLRLTESVELVIGP